jgi:hypothetical protein
MINHFLDQKKNPAAIISAYRLLAKGQEATMEVRDSCVFCWVGISAILLVGVTDCRYLQGGIVVNDFY